MVRVLRIVVRLLMKGVKVVMIEVVKVIVR